MSPSSPAACEVPVSIVLLFLISTSKAVFESTFSLSEVTRSLGPSFPSLDTGEAFKSCSTRSDSASPRRRSPKSYASTSIWSTCMSVLRIRG
ncbi:hypothetical protein M758_UG036600 [Ceratodon purpureus]|nr:hypothetical protein M758_UG036600 [Ceratodon purpureus]